MKEVYLVGLFGSFCIESGTGCVVRLEEFNCFSSSWKTH